MAQDLTVNIKTTSDVPQAMEKAKTATNGFNKQVEDIGKKFSTSFKDIFLSFLGPMALLTGAIALIGKLIAENQKKQEEANQSAIDGTNKLMSAEDRYYARKRDKEEQSKKDSEEAKEQRLTTTREFLQNDPRAADLDPHIKDFQSGKKGFVQKFGLEAFVKNPKIQEQVFKIIAEDIKNDPSENVLDDKKAGTFKGPEGFGTVVGVGPNPVMEKMTRQNEILEEIKIILQEQSLINRGGMVPSPFTEAVPLTLQKMGAV
jgi:hypothetical protein